MIFAIVRDLFGETTAHTKIANVVVTIDAVTTIAPTPGAALMTVGGWRFIYSIQAGIGALLLLAVLLGFAESARIDPTNRLAPAIAIRSYVCVLTHPLSSSYVLVGAGSGATVFAYVTGSSPFFVGAVGLRLDDCLYALAADRRSSDALVFCIAACSATGSPGCRRSKAKPPPSANSSLSDRLFSYRHRRGSYRARQALPARRRRPNVKVRLRRAYVADGRLRPLSSISFGGIDKLKHASLNCEGNQA